MFDALVNQLPSLGISGLLFVMWWYERQERGRMALNLHDATRHTAQVVDVNDHLLSAIRANTEALAALREELRSYRTTETEWLGRLSRQLEALGAA